MAALRSLVARIRAHPWLTVAIVAAAILVVAWLAWAAYVASDQGVNEGVGVLIAWPALLTAAALICLPFVGGYRLIKRLGSEDDGAPGEASEEKPETAAG